MRNELAFVMLKPDALQRRLVGEIISRFERKGLKLVGMKMIMMGRRQAEELYEAHKGKDFFEPLINFVTSHPVIVMVWEGENAVAAVRQLVGATNPIDAATGSIRGDFGLNTTMNLIHAADSVESSVREMNIFFSSDELFDV